MPDSQSGGVVSYAIQVNGEDIPGSYPVRGLRVERGVNRIATATLTLLDGSPATESFAISASATFVPGNEVTLEAGYDGLNSVLFRGIVTRQVLRADSAAGPVLEIECKDKAVKMTVGRNSANFSDQTDSDVIRQLIDNAGLAASVATTPVTLPTLIQYYATDWDFIVSRAEANGLLVRTLDNQVSVFDPTASTSSVRTLTYGSDILAFDAQLDALSQLSQVTASAWSFQDQQLTSASASDTLNGPGNLTSKTLAGVVGLTSFALQTAATETNDELSCWAKAQLLRSGLSKITGQVRYQGDAQVVPGNYITLAGLGGRFDGDHFVSAVVHELADGDWVTEAAFGLAPEGFTQTHHDVQAPPAAGLLPGTPGLFNGTVLKLADDPDGEFRVQVEVALFADAGTGLWARMANFYSTGGQGTFFLPEVGDEVILGFLNQDPRFPVILGSLYSQKRKPYGQFTPNAQNSLKGIVSKSELRVMFDDENKVLSLITPAGNSLVLSDQDQQLQVKDQNGNSITLSSAGIAIKSPGNLSLEADGALSLKGATGVSIQSSAGDVQAQALNIAHKADMQFSANGSMSAEVQGGMQLTLKGALVMIN